MPDFTYKCPSCGGYLNFDPDTQKWKCPYCASVYSEDEIGSEEKADAAASAEKSGGGQVVYRCQSCGSEIITDETTVATHCYYCHSPVVLEGKMQDDMRPDEVLPFTISKEKAVSLFLEWVKKKKFIPKAFFSEEQIQLMSGVYYPHFVTDITMEGTLDGEATNVRVINSPTTITTHTDHFRVRREGMLHFKNIMRPALSKQNRKLSDAIHPFPLENAKPFSGAYLSGFLAERRDIDKTDVQKDVQQEAAGYVKPLLQNTVSGYNNVSATASSRMTEVHSRYVLLPTWVLTYPNLKKPDEPYYYAMNGCTGEVCGKLPVYKKKTWLTGAAIGAGVLAIALAICYFLI